MHPLLLVLIILLLFGGFGASPIFWNHGYGWYPTGGAGGLILLILLIVLITGRRD